MGMVRGRGSSHSSRGGRGGAGGHKPRGRTEAASHETTSAPVKRSLVSAFPVISRGSDSVTSTVPAGRSAHQQQSQRSRSGLDDNDESPPVAVSARRGPAAAAEEESSGFIPPSLYAGKRGRGRGLDRGGRGRGEGQGGDGGRHHGGRGDCALPSRYGGHSKGSSNEHEKTNVSPTESGVDSTAAKGNSHTRVITTVTADGTELPKKLNTKVFMDGLPYTYANEPGKPTLEDEVLQFASAWKVGKPLRLIKKPGQGFGFLVLQSPNSVSTAVRVLNGRKFLGRSLRVEEPKPKDYERMSDIGGMKDMGKDSFTRQVLLTDLAKVAQPEIIREVLRDVAPQLEKRLEAIKMTSQNRKAFLTFETEAEVAPAITFLDGFHLLGRRISATKAAAPGSLPYSHGGAGPSRTAGALAARGTTSASSKAGGPTAEEVEEDDEVTVMPLGLEPAKTTPAALSPAATRRRVQAENAPAPAPGVRSNVTGRTEKYNLLDDGPKDVYVGNIGEDVTEAQLRHHFAPCGAIRKCEILVHPETHLSRGIAHIEFALPAYAAYAQERYHGSRLRGCVLRVDRGEAASVPLVAELPPEEAEDNYDEDAYMERYGVKDKKKYFTGTSLAAEMGAYPDTEDTDDTDDELEGALVGRAKDAPKKGGKRQRGDSKRAALVEAPTKRTRAEAQVSKAKSNAAAVAAKESDDDDDDEHFFDVDTVEVSAGGASVRGSSHASGKKLAKRKGTAAARGRLVKGKQKQIKKS